MMAAPLRLLSRRPGPACDLGIYLHEQRDVWVYHCHTHETLFISGSCPRAGTR